MKTCSLSQGSIRTAVVATAALLLVGAFLSSVGTPSARGDGVDLHVDAASGHDTSTCGSVAHPCASISYAVYDRAGEGDTILVAQGTYTEDLVVSKGITLRGGYESDAWTRDVAAHDTVVHGTGTASVIRLEPGSDDATLDGFTVTGGGAIGLQHGGGICVKSASPTIISNTVTGNHAEIAGGGIFVADGAPLIRGNRIENNESDYAGGGIDISQAAPRIEGNTISGNKAIMGAGIRLWDSSSVTMTDNAVTENSALHGGGILVADSSSPAIRENTITSNTAGSGGGIFVIYRSSPHIVSNIISSNEAEGHGGGIRVARQSSPTIEDNLIHDNEAWVGGAIDVWDASIPSITGNEITDNEAGKGAGLHAWASSWPQITGNTFASNTAHVNGGALWASHNSALLDEDGDPLPEPDTRNTYDGNEPNDVYYEPAPPTAPDPGPGDDIRVPADYSSIQASINVADDWDTVIVAPGIYTETLSFPGKTITVRSEDPEDPTTVAATVIDGGGSNQVVIFEEPVSTSTVLSGFTIRNGSTSNEGGGILCRDQANPTISHNVITGNTTDAHGGGIACWNSAPAILDNVISGNAAEQGGGVSCDHACSAVIRGNVIQQNVAECGGGISGNSSSPTIENNLIAENAAGDCLGGGVGFAYSSPTIISNTIRNNTVGIEQGSGEDGSGGGITIDCCYAAPLIENNLILENEVGLHGGGIYQEQTLAQVRRNVIEDNKAALGGGIASTLYDAAMMEDNVIGGNAAERAGGGIWQATASSIIVGNVITGNKAGEDGGALSCSTSVVPHVVNNLIVENEAGRRAGGIAAFSCRASLLHNTLIGNREGNPWQDSGAMYVIYGSVVTVTNSILWDNGGQPGILVDGATLTVTHSTVEGGWPGAGNVALDPLLVDLADGDYHLRFGSPCIDAGVAAALASDFEGDARPFDGDGDGTAEYDMGADEWVGTIHQAYLPLTLRIGGP